jgi:hypothetical protein
VLLLRDKYDKNGNLKGFQGKIAVVGAEGVLIGTGFLVTQESPIHDNYKNALIGAADTDTVSLNFPSFSIRFWKNKRAMELKDDFIDDELLWKLVSELSDVTDIQGGAFECWVDRRAY